MDLLTFMYNGYSFDDILGIDYSFKEPSYGASSSSTGRAGTEDGRFLVNIVYDVATITIPYVIFEGDVLKKWHELKRRLYVREAGPLVLSDDASKQWPRCIPEDLKEPEVTGHYEMLKGEITFTSLTPYKESINPTRVEMVDGMFDFASDTEVETPVTSFNFSMGSENGYLSVGGNNTEEVIGIGGMTEQDTESYSKTILAFNDGFGSGKVPGDLSKWEKNVARPAYPYGNVVTGTMGTHLSDNGDFAAYGANFNDGGVRTMWYGPSIYSRLKTTENEPNGYLNLHGHALFAIRDVKRRSFGVAEFNYYDTNGKVVAGVRFRNLSYGVIECWLYVNGVTVKSWNSSKDIFLRNFRGSIDLYRNGPTFRFTVINMTNNVKGGYSITDTSLATTPIAGIGYWVAKMSGSSLPMQADLLWAKVNGTGSETKDVTNSFTTGDDVEIRQTDSTVDTFVNGVPSLNLQDIGSEPIHIKHGLNRFPVSWSSFATGITGYLEYKKRWV